MDTHSPLPRPKLDPRDPSIYERAAEQAVLLTSPLQLLSVVPVMWVFMSGDDYFAAATSVLVALKALQDRPEQWDTNLMMCAPRFTRPLHGC